MQSVAEPARMNEAFARAFNGRRLEDLLALYEDGAVLCADASGRSHRGKEAIAQALAELLAAPGTMTSVNNFCLQQGDVALLRADWTLHAAGGAVLAQGSSAEVVRRQPDGRWLYVLDHAAGAVLPRVA
jgi:ketosteroid isomerase-like protein